MVSAQRSFAADASHQLKSPLTALRLRLENLEPDLSDDHQANVVAAIAEVNRLTRMIHGLLALARLEEGAGDRDRIDLDDLIADRVDSWAAYAEEHQVIINQAGGTAGAAWAIPGAVEQIIDNLLANAVRVAPLQTTITITHRTTTDTVELHIIDEGPGMNEADRARAFDRFWRTTNSENDGSGLGLTIVRQLARAGGGEAELNAAPGGGINATVRLERAPAVDGRQEPVPRADARTDRS
nr:HAMP domain-containing sensor histidine kinase [Actinoplanes sp. ATCC 53533]